MRGRTEGRQAKTMDLHRHEQACSGSAVVALDDEALTAVETVMGESQAAPHLATLGSTFTGRPRVTLHLAANLGSRTDRSAMLEKLRAGGIETAVRVRNHSGRRLASARSLEAFAALYGGEAILIDPTGVVGRARALGEFAKRLRAERGGEVFGLYWHARWRTIYVVLDHRHFFEQGKTKTALLAEAENATRAALEQCCGKDAASYVQAVRLAFELPDVALTPIDSASCHRSGRLLARLRGRAKGPAVATMLGLAGTLGAGAAGAADLVEDVQVQAPVAAPPAVSAPNAKIAISGGKRDFEEIDDVDGLGMAEGSFTVPLSERFGLQVDGAAATIEDGHYWGVGGHLFWRDPTVGLVGLVGAYGEVDRDSSLFLDQQAGMIGVETELYADQFTLYATAGGIFGDNIDDGFYGTIDFGWYATDDLLFKIGAATNGDTSLAGTASVEWQPAIDGVTGLALFAEGAAGEGDFFAVRAGLRFYFGQGPTLKDRHRYDDPETNAAGDLIQNGVFRPVKRSYNY